MKINRHNYEEFFLLYLDNELDITDRILVENFIAENADLQQEFYQFKQTISLQEPIIFKNKKLLFKDVVSDETREQLFLHLDNELPLEHSLTIEKLIKENSDVNEEYSVLKNTILPFEQITFTNKQLLYKEEESKIIPFPWFRISVAAIFIGLLTITWIFKDDLFKSNTVIKTVQTKPILQKKLNNNNSQKDVALNSPINNVKKINNKTTKQLATKNANIKIETPRVEIDFELAQLNRVAPTIQHNETISNKLLQKLDPQELKNSIVSTKDSETKTSDIATPTVYKMLDTSDEENNTILIGSSEINKKKLKNIFKSVSKLFGNSKEDEGKINIAAFEIKTNQH